MTPIFNAVAQPGSHLGESLASTPWPELGHICAKHVFNNVAQPWPHLTETCFQQYRTTLLTERNMSSASQVANLVNICAEPVFSQQGDPTLAIKAVEAFVSKVLGHQTRMLWGFCGGFVGALWGLCGGFCVEGAWPSRLWGLLC